MPGLKQFDSDKRKNTVAAAYYRQQDIIDKICGYFNLPFETLQDKTRKGEVVFARQVCQWFLMKKSGLTCTIVASIFFRDHTSVLHSIKTINNMLEADYDNPTKYHINQLKSII
jgi:chromosomal replication initiation ATPase DnaA